MIYDMIIAGGGPAGMTAALYGLRNGKTVLVIEKGTFGGQITHSPRVENYPGTLQMSGNAFAESLLDQILQQGAEIEMATVTGVQDLGGKKAVTTDDGTVFEGRAVILATGVEHRRLGLPGEEELIGAGISFCATCDGDFFAGKPVCVAGGGNSALQTALLLSDLCKSVTILQDLPACTGEQRLQDALARRDNVQIQTSVKIQSLISANDALCGVTVQDKDGVMNNILCDGLFVCIGMIPQNQDFAHLVSLDRAGYIDVDETCRTGTPGIYVAGDCRRKHIRQLATAISDGACAAMAAIEDMQ